MTQVFHTSQLNGHFISGFSGKNYEMSIKLAQKFAERNKVTMVNYFEQELGHKSILVSFD